jgi:hypothetical protein
VIEFIVTLKHELDKNGDLTDGIDNQLQGLVDQLESHVYLLHQRTADTKPQGDAKMASISKRINATHGREEMYRMLRDTEEQARELRRHAGPKPSPFDQEINDLWHKANLIEQHVIGGKTLDQLLARLESKVSEAATAGEYEMVDDMIGGILRLDKELAAAIKGKNFKVADLVAEILEKRIIDATGELRKLVREDLSGASEDLPENALEEVSLKLQLLKEKLNDVRNYMGFRREQKTTEKPVETKKPMMFIKKKTEAGILKSLIKLATSLDGRGLYSEADKIDEMVQMLAQRVGLVVEAKTKYKTWNGKDEKPPKGAEHKVPKASISKMAIDREGYGTYTDPYPQMAKEKVKYEGPISKEMLDPYPQSIPQPQPEASKPAAGEAAKPDLTKDEAKKRQQTARRREFTKFKMEFVKWLVKNPTVIIGGKFTAKDYPTDPTKPWPADKFNAAWGYFGGENADQKIKNMDIPPLNEAKKNKQ